MAGDFDRWGERAGSPAARLNALLAGPGAPWASDDLHRALTRDFPAARLSYVREHLRRLRATCPGAFRVAGARRSFTYRLG